MPINDFRGTHSHDDVFNHVIIRCHSVSVAQDIISTNLSFMNLGIYSIYTNKIDILMSKLLIKEMYWLQIYANKNYRFRCKKSHVMFFMCSKYTEFVSLFIIVTIFILHVRTTWTHFYCLNFRWVIFTRSWFEHFRLNIKRWNTKVSDFCDFTKIMRMRFRFNIKKYITYREKSLS